MAAVSTGISGRCIWEDKKGVSLRVLGEKQATSAWWALILFMRGEHSISWGASVGCVTHGRKEKKKVS
jgi:hypothetical protein